MTLLRSLHGFFRQIDIKAGHATSSNRSLDPQEVERRRKLQEEYRTEVCSLFDEFTRHGLPRNEAVKQTNAAMKKRNSPWATHDLITSVLRSEGRFRKKKTRSGCGGAVFSNHLLSLYFNHYATLYIVLPLVGSSLVDGERNFITNSKQTLCLPFW